MGFSVTKIRHPSYSKTQVRETVGTPFFGKKDCFLFVLYTEVIKGIVKNIKQCRPDNTMYFLK